MNSSHFAGTVLPFLLLCTVPLQAQPQAPRRVPVTVVLADQLSRPDAPFVIQRRANSRPGDVIVLRSDATPSQLSDAIRALMTARQAGGDSASVTGTMRMRPHASSSAVGARGRPAGGRMPRNVFPWADRVLRDLRQSPVREVAGIGRVKAVEVWLPRQNGVTRRRS